MTREEAARWLAGRLRANWHNASSEAIEAAFLALTAPQVDGSGGSHSPDETGKLPTTGPAATDPAKCACGSTATHKETTRCTPRNEESERRDDFDYWKDASIYKEIVNPMMLEVMRASFNWGWQAARRRKP